MSLISLVDNSRTDKNTCHSYLELYDELFLNKKNTAKNILEIGIGEEKKTNGGSIRLWYEYFANADIYAIDIIDIDNVWSDIINVKDNKHKIKLYTSTDAYDEKWYKKNIVNTGIKFDIIIDDGPHTLESMVQFIKLYSSCIADDGIIVVEDIFEDSKIDALRDNCPKELKPYIKIYDRRKIKGRLDDRVFVIDLTSKLNMVHNSVP